MPDSIPAVEGERHGNRRLDQALCDVSEGTESLGDGRRLEVPAEQRRDGVGSEEGVGAGGEGNTSDTVEGGEDPGELGLVDAEMGSDGAVETLLLEDGLGLRLGGGGSVDGVSSMVAGWTVGL